MQSEHCVVEIHAAQCASLCEGWWQSRRVPPSNAELTPYINASYADCNAISAAIMLSLDQAVRISANWWIRNVNEFASRPRSKYCQRANRVVARMQQRGIRGMSGRNGCLNVQRSALNPGFHPGYAHSFQAVIIAERMTAICLEQLITLASSLLKICLTCADKSA